MRTSLEAIHHSVLLNLPQELGNSAKVTLSAQDGPMVRVDVIGKVRVASSAEPGGLEVREAISSILRGMLAVSRVAGQAKIASTTD